MIKTKRLMLKPLSDDDGDALISMFKDDLVKKTYLVPDLSTEEEGVRLFERLKALSISEKHFVRGVYFGDRLIGFLNDTEIHDDRIELGYVIAPAYHNCGFATEALTAMIAYLFEKGFEEVTAGAFEDNLASIRVMEKSGMTQTKQKSVIEYRGARHNCVYYSIRKLKKK